MTLSHSVSGNSTAVDVKDEFSRISAQLASELADLEKSDHMELEEWVRSGSKKQMRLDDGISLG